MRLAYLRNINVARVRAYVDRAYLQSGARLIRATLCRAARKTSDPQIPTSVQLRCSFALRAEMGETRERGLGDVCRRCRRGSETRSTHRRGETNPATDRGNASKNPENSRESHDLTVTSRRKARRSFRGPPSVRRTEREGEMVRAVEQEREREIDIRGRDIQPTIGAMHK